MFNTKNCHVLSLKMKTAFFVSLVLSVVFCVFRTLTVIQSTDLSTGFASGGNDLLVNLTVGIPAGLSVILMILNGFFSYDYVDYEPEDKNSKVRVSPYTNMLFKKTGVLPVFMSAFLGFSFIFAFILCAISMIGKMQSSNTVFSLITLVLSFFSGAFFIMAAALKHSPYRISFAVFSLFPPLWAAIRVIYQFMDTDKYLVTSENIGMLICLAFIALFFLGLSRFTLPDRKYHNIGFLFCAALGSMIMIFSVSLPSVICGLKFCFEGNSFNVETLIFRLCEFVILTYVICTAARISYKVSEIDDSVDSQTENSMPKK